MRVLIINILILITFSVNFSIAQSYKKKKLEINTEFSEFGPAIYKNGITFCSDRKNNYIIIVDEKNGGFLSDIYVSFPDSNSIFNQAEIFSHEITTYYNEGPLCFSKDYSKIYFTRSQEIFKKVKDITRKKNNLGIFQAELIDGKYSNIIPLEFVKKENNYAHPTISDDGNTLYYISDIKGGNGSTDIYYSTKTNNGWSDPINLGNKLNSDSKEMFPFIHSSGKLFFSSDRKDGQGGLDIYYSIKKGDEWSEPIALDTNFNTNYDDFSYICNSSMDTGYYCSNKNGTDDIFQYIFEFPDFGNPDSMRYANLCYDLYEETAILQDSLPLEYEWEMGDGTKYKGPKIKHCYTKPDFYTINLNVINTISGELYQNDATYELLIEEVAQPEIFIEDTIYVDQKFQVNSSIKRLGDLTDVNYYWEMGDGNQIIGKEFEYTFSKEGEYKIKLLVIGTSSYGEIERSSVFKKVVVLKENRI